MATIDLTRHATDFRKHYAGVRLQQGRVLTDDDFNEASRIDQEDMRRTRVHVIGAAGSPDAGFLVSSPTVTAGVADFAIAAGTLYLGGLRLEMSPAEGYRNQRDWLRRPASAAIALPGLNTTRYDLVWIEALAQPVSAVEDGELFEIALSGPDTSARMRTMRRVFVRENVGNVPCPQAWSTLVASWAGSGTLNQELEFTTDATLTVGFDPGGGTPGDLCSPPVAGGYLGAENQAIRVQLTDATHFLWGFDNAAPLYRVEVETDAQNNRRVIRMATEPKDQAHWPLVNQWVELLPWSAVLPNGEKVAERSGHLARVDGSYNPDTQRFTIALADAVPAAFGLEWQSRPDAAELGPTYFYLRVWNRGADTTTLPVTFAPGTPVALPGTGLLVTINGTQRRAEDFWIIAARPESPNRVSPWQLESGRAPHGYRRFRAPLAIVRWTNTGGVVTGTVIDDCRDPFLPLTRIRSCCTYTVGDGVSSQGHFSSIQAAINALPPEGGEVCVLPGTYNESVHIANRQNVTLHGCGPRSRVQAPGTAPVVRIASSSDITVEKLALVASASAPGILVDATPLSQRLRFAALHITAGPRSAIELPGGAHVTIAECVIRQTDVPGPWPAVFSAADDVRIVGNSIEVLPTTPKSGSPSAQAGRGGLQLGGGSERVRVIDNVIRGGIGNGITLGSIEEVGGGGVVIVIWPWVVDFDDPCSPCKPGDVYIPPGGGGGGGGPRFRSAGALYEIVIEHNRILDMGLNGIGVAAFFDPASEEMITVSGLTIDENEIAGCLRRPLALIPAGMVDSMGYGGIALADCDDLVIVGNLIENNGPDHLEPVCGVYVLSAEGVELSDNRILNTGARTAEPASSARPGPRGGIHIQLAMAPLPTAPVGRFGRRTGVPAVKIHDNVVTQPLGRALAVRALGPVSVQDNRLVSQGFVPGSVGAIATTVVILNLGLSNELPERHLVSILNGFGGKVSGPSGLSLPCNRALDVEEGDILPGVRFPSGKVLFTGNQCTLDLMNAEQAFALSSIAIATPDDLGFLDNQCECDLSLQFVLAPTLLAAMTVRAGGNRWSEGWAHAIWSAVTFGVLNATTNNQSTHCLLVLALRSDLRVETGNVALLEAFCPDLCGRRG